MLSIKSLLISGGVNSVYQAIDWCKMKNVIAYTCSNQILLYDPILNRVWLSLSIHGKRINTVKFIQINGILYLICGGADGNVVIWENNIENPFEINSWKILHKINVGASVERITIEESNKTKALIVIHNINGQIDLYELNNLDFEKINSLNFGNNVQECSKLLPLKDDIYLLALGGLDNKFHLYWFNIKNKKNDSSSFFEYLLTIKGHDNSITDIAEIKLTKNNENYFFIATASKDSTIRLYKFQTQKEKKENNITNVFQNKNTHYFLVDSQPYEILLESILSLHTEAVSSIVWGFNTGSKSEENLILLSSSFDFSLLLWSIESKSGIWTNNYRLGQMGGNKNAFFGALFSSDYNQILAYTYNGGFYNWSKGIDKWESNIFISGHFNKVTDLDWNSTNDYLVSCSLDQTTRVFSEWNHDNYITWHEISRAQIHGYDINSIKNLKLNSSKQENKIIDFIVCGAEEKIIRLFEPTAIFANLINILSKKDMHLYFNHENEEKQYLVKNEENLTEYQTLTEGGAQVLGLMTKAVKVIKEKYTNYYDEEDELANEENKDIYSDVSIHNYKKPPIEDYLFKHTLWPENNKLYGHGYEIQTVTCNHSGTLIASTCKSQTYDHSSILLWNPVNFSIIDKLLVHNYTVIQLEFSPDDEYLGSVSRDRQFVIFKKNNNDLKQPYKQIFVNKSHNRIINSISFSHNSKYVVTGSRDKKIKIWKIENEKITLSSELGFSDSVNAVAFADKFNMESNYLIAVGLENGKNIFVDFCQNSEEKGMVKIISEINEFIGHNLGVNRLKFRKVEEKNIYQLASAGEDHTVRINEIKIKN